MYVSTTFSWSPGKNQARCSRNGREYSRPTSEWTGRGLAGYYSYKWAEVLSADAFGAFEEAGLDDPEAVAETGQRYRDTVLALGGSEHPMEVFKHFRGRPPTPDALLRHAGLAEGA